MSENRKYKLMYLFTYAPIGVVCPLIGQYLSSIGFSGTQIGTITAVSTGVSIFASTFWGDKYSNSKNGKTVILLLCVCAAAMAIVNLFVSVFLIFVATYSVMYFFQGPVMGLSDAMILENNQNFAVIRLYGAIGYAASVFMGGKIGGIIGLKSIFVIYTIAYLIAAIILSSMKTEQRAEINKPKSKADKVKYSQLLKEKKTIQLIICGIFVFGTNVANNTYFSFLFIDGGGTVSGVGTIFLLMVGSEAPFMGLAPKAAEKISQQKLIAVAMCISAGRFALYATGPSYVVLLCTFFLQGMVNGVLLVEYMKYISNVVNPKLIGIAISAFYAISSSGGTIICNYFGGVAMDMFGSKGVYFLFSSLNIIGIILYYAFGLQKNKISKVVDNRQ